MAKSLVAYFSRGENNRLGGKTVGLPAGNTEIVAKEIARQVDGELFRIERREPYPDDYGQTTKVASEELIENARPELTATVRDFDSCDVIYLCFPIWWDAMPMPVLTFLDTYDFSGKTVIPFCTHEGSGFGRSGLYIEKACRNANIIQGLAIRMDRYNDDARQVITDWITNQAKQA